MKEIAWVTDKGEIIEFPKNRKQPERLDIWPAEFIKEYYPHAEYDYADEYLMEKGWANIVKLSLVEEGIYVSYRTINDATYEAINQYMKRYDTSEFSHKFLTDWAYESVFH